MNLLACCPPAAQRPNQGERAGGGGGLSTNHSLASLLLQLFPSHSRCHLAAQKMIKEHVVEAEAGGDMISYLHLSTKKQSANSFPL